MRQLSSSCAQSYIARRGKVGIKSNYEVFAEHCTTPRRTPRESQTRPRIFGVRRITSQINSSAWRPSGSVLASLRCGEFCSRADPNICHTSGQGLNSLRPSILAFNLLSTLRDLIINILNLQSQTEIIRTLLVSLE